MSLRSSTKSKCSTCEILYEQLLDVSHGEERRYFSSLMHSIEVALLENIDIIAAVIPDEICELLSSQWYWYLERLRFPEGFVHASAHHVFSGRLN